MQKKILGTLWRYQRINYPNGFSQRWTFAVGPEDPEYPEFLEAIGGLAKLRYVSMNPADHRWAIDPAGIMLMTNLGSEADRLEFFVY
jgi:hypothetical protein